MTSHPSWGRSLTVLATTTAVAVSTVYLPQPLLTDLAHRLGTSTSEAGAIATAVQLGYALGIFLLVPLADHLQPRRQISVQVLLLAAGLVVTAALPTAPAVAAGFFVVGLVANIAQLIIPTAVRLAPAGAAGSTTTALVGSLLIGIFGGRTVAGLLGSLIGWRGVLLVFAALVLLCLPAVRRVLPAQVPVAARTRYLEVLLTTVRRVGSSRTLLESAVLQFFGFAAFNALWTVVVLHLTGPLRWSLTAASAFGGVGLAAGIATLVGARFVARFRGTRVVGWAIVVLLAALAAVVVDNRNPWLFAPSVLVLTWANQVLQSANQGRVLAESREAAAQANTVFMTAVFLGGSLGASLGPAAFARGGMTEVAGLGVVLVGTAGLVRLVTVLRGRRARVRPDPGGHAVGLDGADRSRPAVH